MKETNALSTTIRIASQRTHSLRIIGALFRLLLVKIDFYTSGDIRNENKGMSQSDYDNLLVKHYHLQLTIESQIEIYESNQR